MDMMLQYIMILTVDISSSNENSMPVYVIYVQNMQ